MKHLLFICFCLVVKSLFAQQVLQPSLVQWHSRYDIEKMTFSADGNYFITLGDDNSVIISDLRKRLPITRINSQDKIFFAAHPAEPFFYTNEKVYDSILIFKRGIPSAQIVHRTAIPLSLKAGCRIQSFQLVELNTEENFMVAYSCNNQSIVAEYDHNGKLLQTVVGDFPDRTRAIAKYKGNIIVAATDGLYHQVDTSFKKILSVGNSNESFANLQLHGDSIVLLSNTHVSWFNLINHKLLRKTDVSSFFSQSINDSRGRLIEAHHPFVVDRSGAAWVTNTSIQMLEDRVQQKPYSLAKITDKITYPLLSNENTTAALVSVESLVAYNAKANIFVVNQRQGGISFVDPAHGSLFEIGRKNLPVKNVSFTSAPGKILLQVDDIHSPAFMINLSNGRMETMGVMDELLYSKPSNRGYFKNYLPQKATERLFIPAVKSYVEASYMLRGKDPILKYPFKDQLSINVVNGMKISLATGGVLQLIDANGTIQKKLLLYALKDETRDYVDESIYVNGRYLKVPFGENHLIKEFTYDSTTQQLALSIVENWTNNDPTIHFIDVKDFKIIKSYVAERLGMLPASKLFVTGYGIFSINDNRAFAKFPEECRFASLFVPSYDEQRIFFIVSGYSERDKLYCFDFADKKVYELGAQYGIQNIVCDPHSPLVYTLGLDGALMIWNGTSKKLVGQLMISGKKQYKELAEVDGSYLVLLENGFYMGENKYYHLLKLHDRTTSYSINEIDVLFHRPDEVLATLGYANASVISPLKQIADKRAKRSNLSITQSDISISSKEDVKYYSGDNTVVLNLSLPKDLSDVQGLMIYINGTAIWSKPKMINAVSQSVQIKVELVDEVNHIRVSLVRKDNKETPGDYVYVNSKPVEDAEIYIIGLGVSKYKDSTQNLRYAAKDMNDLINYLYTTDTYRKTHIKRFSDQQVTANIIDSIQLFLKSTRSQDVVLCYFAGHGLLDKNNDYYLATHYIDFSNPSGSGLDIRKLNDVISTSTARKKMIFIDACHSGLVDDLATTSDTLTADVKGVVKRGFSIKGAQKASTVQFNFNHFNQGSGVDILAASAGNEYALELGDIRNGVFTWSALQALKSGEADYNNDKKLTLYELQQYVSKSTRQLTKGAQRPTFRQNNLYQDIVLLTASDSYVGRFMTAAKLNDLQTVKFLIENNEVSVDQKDKEGFAALHYAAREGSFNVVKYLVEKEASISLPTSSLAATPLYLAAWNNHYRVAYYLLTMGASVSNDIKQWEMQKIIEKNHQATINVLNNFPILKVQQDKLRDAAYAFINNKIETADSILSKEKLSVNDHLLVEGLPLVVAPILGKSLAGLKWIISKGANVNLASLDDGYTPLMFAANSGETVLVKFLIEMDADKALKDRFGQTAADYALKAGYTELAALLE